MTKKILSSIFFLLSISRIVNASVIYSLQINPGVKWYNQSILLPMGSEIYRNKSQYGLLIGPNPIFNRSYIDLFYGTISSKNENYYQRRKAPDKDRLYFSKILNEVIISGRGLVIPISGKVEYEFHNRFRIGAGATIELDIIKEFKIEEKQAGVSEQVKQVRENKALVKKIFEDYLSNESNKEDLKRHLSEFKESDLPALEEVLTLLDDKKATEYKRSYLRILIREMKERDQFSKENSSKKLDTLIYRKSLRVSFTPFVDFAFKFLSKESFDMFLEYRFYPLAMHILGLTEAKLMRRDFLPNCYGHYIGVIFDKNISEYFSTTLGLSFKFNYYSDKKNNLHLPFRKNISYQFGIDIGLSFQKPNIERCYIKHCSVQKKHRHKNEPLRGKDMYKGKDTMGFKLFKKKGVV